MRSVNLKKSGHLERTRGPEVGAGETNRSKVSDDGCVQARPQQEQAEATPVADDRVIQLRARFLLWSMSLPHWLVLNRQSDTNSQFPKLEVNNLRI